MPPPIEHEADDAFWSLVLAAARNRARVEYVEHRRDDRPERGLAMDPYGMPRVRHEDAARVEIRLMTLDTHVIPARAARDEIGRILGYPRPAHPPPLDTPTSDECAAIEAITRAEAERVATVDETIAMLEAVAQQATETVRATLPSPIPSPPTPPPQSRPEPPPESGPEDGASIRYSLMELD